LPSSSPSRISPTPSRSCPADNGIRSWYYTPNDAHVTPAVPSDVKRLLRDYGGHYVGNTGERVVYLTFDEGYENGFTAQILDALADAGVEAAFFVTGSYVRNNPDLVRRMADEGHVVANHTDTHPSLPSLAFDAAAFGAELAATARAYENATGRRMARLLRPPAGEYSARSLCQTRRLGYETVFWSFAHRDWLVDEQPTVSTTLQRLLGGSHPGALYLLHAVSSSNTKALPRFIAGMRARDYRFAPLTELPR
jgi:peptidoglycan-N-acetylmuramic acid deacetylase